MRAPNAVAVADLIPKLAFERQASNLRLSGDDNGRRSSLRASFTRLTTSLEGLEVGHSLQDDAVAVHVTKTVYVAIWLATFAIRCLCVVFLAGTMRVYWFIAHPYMSYYASLLGPQAVEHFKPIGVCFGIVAAAHAWHVLQMVYYSFTLRRLVLDAPPSCSSSTKRRQTLTRVETFHNDSGWRSWIRWAVYSIRLRWLKLFDRQGFFGVESEFFHLRFVSRELVEIVSQSAQVYNSSVLIAKVWINNLYVGLMVVNCCSTPLLQAIFRESPALERLLCLCVDLFLDAAVSMVLPLIIFVPYVHKFDLASFNFEIFYLYDDIWFVNMVMENQQIFALTKWDFLWKIVPHLSMYGCLSNLNALIRPDARKRRVKSMLSTIWSVNSARVSVISCHVPQPISENSVASVRDDEPTEAPELPDAKDQATAKQPVKRTWPRTHFRRRPKMPEAKGGTVVKAVNLGLISWAICIVVLHVMAMRTSLRVEVPGCKQATRPWFASKFSCSVLQYNCHLYNSTFVREEDLAGLQDESVAALVFSHCPELRVPTRIRKFRNLLGVDIFNSTLHEWNADAAITNATHPRLTYIIFVRVNMTRLPDGVLQTLPPSMTDFEIVVSNLTQLPSDLHERWHPMSLVYVEHTHISAFPEALLHLHVDDLSLIGSQISELPEFPVSHGGFFTLAMTRTPLKKLPQSIGDLSSIGFLNLGYTQLAEFPPWMDQVMKTATKIFVHHTPFCASKSDEEIARNYGDRAVLTCSVDGDRADGKYPLALMETRRLYDPPAKS